VLSATAISKRFGGLQAVEDVTLQVRENSIVSLIGPNGAGKTTLFAIMSGFLQPDSGEVVFCGQHITGLSPNRIAELGLVRTFQITQPFAGLTVCENIAVGAHLRIKDRRDALASAAALARRLGLGDRLDQPAAELTAAGPKRLELARAMATGPKMLLLDEVMAGLNPIEITDVLSLIRAIRDSGTTVLLIEHVMPAVISLSDETWVLNNGKLIAHGSPRDVASHARVIEAYLGQGAANRIMRDAAGATATVDRA
jgi:branched-chain amino acid transport system ATP-binding protein